MYNVEQILLKDGLSFSVLSELSYQSHLNVNLKRDLRYFDKESLFAELFAVAEWYDACEILHDLSVDYRIKSTQSIKLKFERYFPEHQARKVFNDILGFRILCDSYQDVIALSNIPQIRVANMSQGKANDDGYRGVHVYYQKDNFHYPIEIQYNTYYDRQLNNWLHQYVYKHSFPNETGQKLRQHYEHTPIKNEMEFKEVLRDVLSDCKKI